MFAINILFFFFILIITYILYTINIEINSNYSNYLAVFNEKYKINKIKYLKKDM